MNSKQPKNDINQELERLDWLAHKLDTNFKIPFTSIRLGYDSLIGLIPVVGDAISGLIGLYIVFKIRKYKLPNKLYFKMILNVLIEFLIGSIPLIGDIFDIAWKCNVKNLNLLKKALIESQKTNL